MDQGLDVFLRYQRLERNASEHTLAAYRRDIEQFAHWILQQGDDDLDWDSVSRDDLRSWIAQLVENGCAKRTLARKMASLRSFFKFLVRRGHISKNPTLMIPSIKLGQRLPQLVTEAEIGSILNDHAEPKDDIEVLHRAILELLYGSGIRVSELTGIKIGNLDLEGQLLRVTGKGRKERIVPIGAEAAKAIRAWLDIRSRWMQTKGGKAGNALFMSPTGGKPYREFVYRVVNKHMRDLEVEQKSPHTLRHSFATHMIDHGADIRIVKEMLGHSSLATTQIYTHTSKEHMRKAYLKAHPRSGDQNTEP